MHPPLVRVIVVACFAVALSFGQQAALQFEVASIRPTVFPSDGFAAGFRAGATGNPCGGGKLSISGTLVSLTAAGICDIIRIAYDVKNYQIVGVPSRLGLSGEAKTPDRVSIQESIAAVASEPVLFYDIEARSPGTNPPSEAQVREMLRGLLIGRFGLTLHRDSRELSYYALVPVKGASKLKPAVEGCKYPPKKDLMGGCGQTMEQLAKNLTGYTDRRVEDRTGLTGKYDYEIPIDMVGERGPAILASVQENLKLKLEPRKGPVEVIVVDHVEAPSKN